MNVAHLRAGGHGVVYPPADEPYIVRTLRCHRLHSLHRAHGSPRSCGSDVGPLLGWHVYDSDAGQLCGRGSPSRVEAGRSETRLPQWLLVPCVVARFRLRIRFKTSYRRAKLSYKPAGAEGEQDCLESSSSYQCYQPSRGRISSGTGQSLAGSRRAIVGPLGT